MNDTFDNYTFQNNNYFITLTNKNKEDILLIQIHNYINNSSFSLDLNLTELNNKNIKCKTINDAMIIFDTFFKLNQISVKQINNYEIILKIDNFDINNDYILLNLKLDSNIKIYYLEPNESQNVSSKNKNLISSNNPFSDINNSNSINNIKNKSFINQLNVL